MKVIEQKGMYTEFPRCGKPHARTTHYCPGCGHGIVNKLIAECCAELGLQDRTIFVDPVGCGVFTYYYWDAAHISAAHGRASAAATGACSARPDAVTIAYQGDGDLGAIGFNNAFQAASRGEKFGCIFINNSLYGMTGGQMAPTTLEGEKTTTTPFGRDPSLTGHPLHVCEVFNELQAPVYIARVSVADTKRIMECKRAIRRVFELQASGAGYALLEILAPCPTNFGMGAIDAASFCMNEMEREFPLGVFRDVGKGVMGAEKTVHPDSKVLAVKEVPRYPTCEALFATPDGTEAPPVEDDPGVPEMRFKFAGYGGQGILSLGICVAEAARLEKRHTLWFPSYGPEQRGGSASCSVVVSGTKIGSPTVEHPDVLVCMNQPSYERFAKDVKNGGLIIVDSSVPVCVDPPEGVELKRVPAIKMAEDFGVPKAANTMMLAALRKFKATGLKDESLETALCASFKKKPQLIEKNRTLLREAEERISL
ncbi:MAG: 2-oxoacid:acceptor oxidoreductase family protein [Kiritimatiellae bacterium]|nr:2-oxoacid:acceptor oxidoreductase family protein [Kiritimatiellia bacterium]